MKEHKRLWRIGLSNLYTHIFIYQNKEKKKKPYSHYFHVFKENAIRNYKQYSRMQMCIENHWVAFLSLLLLHEKTIGRNLLLNLTCSAYLNSFFRIFFVIVINIDTTLRHANNSAFDDVVTIILAQICKKKKTSIHWVCFCGNYLTNNNKLVIDRINSYHYKILYYVKSRYSF